MDKERAKEISWALRCSSTPGGDCKRKDCPYRVVEHVKFDDYEGDLDFCDVDKMVRAAADLIDDLIAENDNAWHRDKADIPPANVKVECRTKTAKGVINEVFGYHSGDRWCVGMNSNVIAWRFIEPFEEDAE